MVLVVMVVMIVLVVLLVIIAYIFFIKDSDGKSKHLITLSLIFGILLYFDFAYLTIQMPQSNHKNRILTSAYISNKN